jgi:HNH endonuclease
MDRPSQYQRYLQSEHWRGTKEAFWNQVEKACEVCGDEDQLEVHHCTYARIGREEWGDLVALCRRCHQAVHRLIENGQAELENAHLVLDGETPTSPLRMRGRIRRSDVLQSDNAKRPFKAASVPLFVEDGKSYTVADLDHIATHMLWMQGIGEHHIFLTRAQWRNRLAPELFASGDVMAPDPSYTQDRHHNSIAGMYNRTHPEGRQWNSEEERKTSGRSFYRNTKVTEHRDVGKFVSSASPTITRNLTKPLSKLEIALMEAEERRAKKILKAG